MKQIDLKNYSISNSLPFILIAGPCVIENRDTVMHIADKLTNISEKYDVVNSKRFEFTGDDSVASIDGALKVKVNKSDTSGNHYDIEFGSGANLNIMVRNGDMNMNVKGNVNQFIDGDLNATMDNLRLDASNKITMTAGGQIKIDGGSVDIDGTPIDLN